MIWGNFSPDFRISNAKTSPVALCIMLFMIYVYLESEGYFWSNGVKHCPLMTIVPIVLRKNEKPYLCWSKGINNFTLSNEMFFSNCTFSTGDYALVIIKKQNCNPPHRKQRKEGKKEKRERTFTLVSGSLCACSFIELNFILVW